MERVKIIFPSKIEFATIIPIQISHINYGNHVGNDSIVSILHEARVQFLNSLGYTELQIENVGLILGDLMVSFKQQLFYGDTIQVEIAINDFTDVAFCIYYKIVKINEGNKIAVLAKTNMIFFDYALQKISTIPEGFKNKFQNR